MFKIFILFALIAAFIGGAVFLTAKYSNVFKTQEEMGDLSVLPSKPWIEVLKQSATQDGRILETGNELELGKTVKTDDKGLAIIHFPDGSVARLDSKSEIVIEEGSYNEKSDTLKVRIVLGVGRLWSRIIQLANPDSFWEVETANAVAAVRGTAFGVEYKEGKFLVLVDKNVVRVAAVNPATKEIIKGTEIQLEETKQIEVKREEIKDIIEGIKKLEPERIKEEVLKSDWVKDNKALDVGFDEKLEELKKQNFTEEQIRRELNKGFFEAPTNIDIELREEQTTEESSKVEPTPETQPESQVRSQEELQTQTRIQTKVPVSSPPASEIQSQTIQGGGGSAVRLAPVALEVTTSANLASIIEGDLVVLRAFLVMDDGTKKEVTKESDWQVIGQIGEMASPGMFRAKLLTPLVREMGSSPGQVAVTWRDPVNGEGFLGTTAIFNVRARVEATPELRG